jgi:TPR repeat protein
MKKIVVLVVMVMTVTLAFGQKAVRQTASNYLKDGKLDKALENINICIQDPSTAQDARAWYIRGNIYLAIANSKEPAYKALDTIPIPKVLESYRKALEYDPKPEYPKKEFYDNIFTQVAQLRQYYDDQGVVLYNAKKYKEAMTYLENAANALDVVNVTDTVSLKWAAQAAVFANEPAKAKELYSKLMQVKVKDPAVYSGLADIYKNAKDSATALKIIREGFKANPNNLTLIIAETNVYLAFSDVDKAISQLQLAAKRDTGNFMIYNALGGQYDKIFTDTTKSKKIRDDAYNNAILYYQKSIKLKPDYMDANLNLGALYFNIAAPIYLDAKNLPLDEKEKYATMIKKANEYYILAVPYLEKVSELDPTNIQALLSLKQAYNSLDNKEKEQIVTDKIKALRKK